MNPSDVYLCLSLAVPVGVVSLVAGALFGWRLSRGSRGDAERLTTRLIDANEKLAELERGSGELQVRVAKAEAAETLVRDREGRHAADLTRIRKQRNDLRDLVVRMQPLSGQLQQANRLLAAHKDEADEQRARADALDAQLQAIGAAAGKVWERAVPSDAPRFVPPGEARRCKILSVISLKGGVGKTTLTLNLAATLADRGKRVLMIDCDHQRSLSALCVRLSRRVELHEAGRTLQHFLTGDRSASSFRSCIQTLPNVPRCSLVVNTASHEDEGGLASVEEQLMLRWLVGLEPADVRLLLRGALHGAETSGFDYIILDCPPRLSTATVNALAACDFVIVPVGLDAVSATNPLPLLLRELRRLRSPEVFPDFDLLGVVANRVKLHTGALVSYERPVWANLPTYAKKSWGEPVHHFAALLPLDAAYERAAKELVEDTGHAVAVWTDDGVKERFGKLADEIIQRIDDETSRPEPVRA